jgi:ArsR family transcriptional regulator
LENITSFFKIMSDTTRLQIVLILLFHGETCVCQFTRCLDAPQSLVSRHLRILRDNGLVESEHKKQWVYYRLGDSLSEVQKSFLNVLRQTYKEHPTIVLFLKKIEENPCL